MDIIIILGCLFLTPTFTIILPMIHKMFRDSFTYFISIICSLGLFVLFAFKTVAAPESDKVMYFVCCVTPITFLLLYKIFDFIVKWKFNRHIYFFANFIGYKDGESENATWLDQSFQMILFIIPGLWWWIGDLIFKK